MSKFRTATVVAPADVSEKHLPPSLWSASKANKEAALSKQQSSFTQKMELSLQVASQQLKRNDTPLPADVKCSANTCRTNRAVYPKGNLGIKDYSKVSAQTFRDMYVYSRGNRFPAAMY